jgi:hypothetical protein
MTRLFTGAALALALVGGTGCLQIEGGAVEVAWVLRHSDNTAGKCDDSHLPSQYRIDRIRLRVTPEDDLGMDLCASADPPGTCEFSCEDGGGTTRFDIPEGTYYFDLVPLTADGSVIPASVVAVPAPLRRTIVEGDITDLGIWQLVIFID